MFNTILSPWLSLLSKYFRELQLCKVQLLISPLWLIISVFTVDKAIESIGFGKFQLLLAVASGIAWTSRLNICAMFQLDSILAVMLVSYRSTLFMNYQ